MAVRKCMVDGKPGLQWDDGECHVYEPGDDASMRGAIRKLSHDAAREHAPSAPKAVVDAG